MGIAVLLSLVLREGSATPRPGVTAGRLGRVLSRRFLRRVVPEAGDQPFLFELIESHAASRGGPSTCAIAV
jgi:hypothetical protein